MEQEDRVRDSLPLNQPYEGLVAEALLDDEDRARAALRSWLAHLRPHGRLAVSMGSPPPAGDRKDPSWEWHVRRSATRADGVTFMVHEATWLDRSSQLQHALHRHEVWNADGTLRAGFMRRQRQRWWTQAQLADALRDCGYVEVETVGSDREFLAFGRAAPR